jgi:cytochrome c oxidase subunit 3
MPDAQPAIPYSDLRQQQHAAELGLWVFLATEVLLFGGLILAYAVYRHADTEAFAEAARHTRIALGTANTAILLTSSFLVAWAVESAAREAPRLAATLFFAAAALGLGFLAVKGFEYAGEIREGLLPGAHFALGDAGHGAALFFMFYFITTGLHALHVTIGITLLAAIGTRARSGAYSARYYAPAALAGLYWHFVDVVWIFLFPLIYLPGRGT